MGGRQFTLRRTMVVIAAWGMMLAWVRSQGSFDNALFAVQHSSYTWGLCFAMGIAIARGFGPAVCGRRGRMAVSGLFVVVFLASAYLAWGRYRAIAMTMYVQRLPHRFPYPDGAINALERWFDARRPVPPGTLKLHGEYPRVGLVLGMLGLGFTSLNGLLLGVLSNRPEGTPQPIDDTSDM